MYSYGVMKNLIFELTGLAENYIALNNFRQNELKMFSELSESLRMRKLNSVLESKNNILTKKFSDSGAANYSGHVTEYFNILYNNSMRNIDFKHIYRYGYDFHEEMQLSSDQNFLNLYTNMVQLFISNFFYSFTSNKISKKTDIVMMIECIPEDFIEKAIKEIKPRSEVKYNILMCYFLAYKLLSDINVVNHYKQFMEFFEESTYCMSIETIADLQILATNIIFLAHPKTFDKPKELYDIYLFRESTNTFLNEDFLTSSNFIGYISILFEEGEADEIENFILKYKHYLFGSDKEDMIDFSNAILNFKKGHYQKTLQMLSTLKFDDFHHECFVRKFVMMAYFELNDYDSFILNLDSVKHFLKYNSKDVVNIASSKYKKWQMELLNKFVNDLNRLFKLKLNSDIAGLIALRNEIEEKDVNLKKSFLRQIDKTISEIPVIGKRNTA